jgi:rhomboid protease GluP
MAPRSITCPNCGRPTDARHSSCLWCGAPVPRPGGHVLQMLRAGNGSHLMIKGIIAANVIFYVLSLLVSKRTGFGGGLFDFLSPDQNSLLLLGATGTVPVFEMGRFWTLISANYLHGGLLHILFNMMALRQIGPWVSIEFGPGRMFIIYTVSGVAGYVASCFAGVPFTIGASASICGLIGALFYFGKSRGGGYGAAVSNEVRGWLISLVVIGLIMPGINNWGHGGGIAGGILAAKVLGYSDRSPETAGHHLIAFICLAATIFILSWAAFLTLSYRLL